MRSLLLLLALLPGTALSETFLCVAEAGAFVEDGGDHRATASIADVSHTQFVQSQESGRWVVKELGKNYVLFNECTSLYFCGRSDGYAGAFIRKPDGRFSATWMTQPAGKDVLIVAKGQCSKI